MGFGDFSNPRYDIRQLVAEADAFAIRFLFTCVLTRTGETFVTEVTGFYGTTVKRVVLASWSQFLPIPDTGIRQFDARGGPAVAIRFLFTRRE